MSQMPSLPGQTSFLAATEAQPKTVKELLKDFAKRAGCEAYKGDSDKIELLTTFIWLRQLTPQLPFEVFLDLYANVADHNDENRKHPEAALKHHCPRRASAVGAGEHQWTAAEVVDFTTLYIDMIREAERTNQPLAMTFDKCLEALKTPFLAGAFKEPEPAPSEKPKRKQATPEPTVVVRPTARGQRIMYTMANEGNRQVRGVVEQITEESGRRYVTFQADGGERFDDVACDHCQVIDDPLPPGPVNVEGQPQQVLERRQLSIPKSVYPQIKNMLTMQTPMGNVTIGDAIHSYQVDFANDYIALLDIVNGETGPYIDARVIHAEKIVAEVPPRRNLDGDYNFILPAGILQLQVKVYE